MPSTRAADPSYVDLDVVWVGKGSGRATRLRVWNESAGTSCGGAFKQLPVGAEIVAALKPVGSSITHPQTGRGARPTPREGDYLIFGACSDEFLVLSSAADREKYVGKTIP